MTPRPQQSAGGSRITDRHRWLARTVRSTASAAPADEPAGASDALLIIDEMIVQLSNTLPLSHAIRATRRSL
jgi:hypothetical protein